MPQPPDEYSPLSTEDDTPSDERLPLTDLESLAANVRSWRKRFIEVALVLVAFVVAFLAIWHVIFPAPLPAPIEPSIQAVLVSNVTYGQVSINGQLQAMAPPLALSIPEHSAITITLEAPPFQTHTCTFQLPSKVDNTYDCMLESAPSESMIVHGVSIHPAALLGIFFQFGEFSSGSEAEQESQVEQTFSAIDQAVSRSFQFPAPAGSYVATGFQDYWQLTSERTLAPLVGELLFGRSQDFSLASQPPSTVPCLLFCPVPLIPGSTPLPVGRVWALSVPVAIHWRFATASNQVVGDAQFPSESSTQVSLTYHPDTGWLVSPQMVADTITAQVPMVNCATGAALLQFYVGIQLRIQPSQHQSLAGCKLNLEQADGTEAHFIWWFGALLALDAQSHAAVPEAPLVPPEELAALGE
jgi:hypothetical protein